MRRLILVAAALFAAALPAWAAEPATVRALMEASRSDLIGEQLERNVAALTAQPPGALPDAAERNLPALAARHFDADAIMAELEAHLVARLQEADAAQMLDWYDSETARRLVEAEVRAAEIPPEELSRLAPDLLRRLQAEDDPRVGLYRRILDGLAAEDLAVAMGLNMTYAMLSGIAGSEQMPIAPSDAQLLAIVRRMEPLMRAQAVESMMLSMVHAYRDVSVEDLDAYAGMVETPAGRSFFGALMAGLEASLVSRAQAFGAEMMSA
ncbi:MAG: hypothetical protein AAFU61_17140, partial [Pseudomonadota bacterium]